jgi:hypothetical protein
LRGDAVPAPGRSARAASWRSSCAPSNGQDGDEGGSQLGGSPVIQAGSAPGKGNRRSGPCRVPACRTGWPAGPGSPRRCRRRGRGDGAGSPPPRRKLRVTCPAPMRSSSRIRCTHALNERQVREGLGEVPQVPAGVRFYLLGIRQQRAGVGRQLLARRPGARLAFPISVSAQTSQNERIVNVPCSPGPAHHHRSRPGPRRNPARPSKSSTAPADWRTSVAEVGSSDCSSSAFSLARPRGAWWARISASLTCR